MDSNKNTKFVIIHGNGGGTSNENWIPWLKEQLQIAGHTVLTPDMPDSEIAHMNIWLPYMENELHVDENTIVIGHSSGAVAAMRYAETHKIKASILIGACYTDIDDDVQKESGYYDMPWNWQSIRDNQEFIVVMHSSDDPWVPVEEARHIYRQLQCEYHEYTNLGHFLPIT